jgi:hypothetical protein
LLPSGHRHRRLGPRSLWPPLHPRSGPQKPEPATPVLPAQGGGGNKGFPPPPEPPPVGRAPLVGVANPRSTGLKPGDRNPTRFAPLRRRQSAAGGPPKAAAGCRLPATPFPVSCGRRATVDPGAPTAPSGGGWPPHRSVLRWGGHPPESVLSGGWRGGRPPQESAEPAGKAAAAPSGGRRLPRRVGGRRWGGKKETQAKGGRQPLAGDSAPETPAPLRPGGGTGAPEGLPAPKARRCHQGRSPQTPPGHHRWTPPPPAGPERRRPPPFPGPPASAFAGAIAAAGHPTPPPPPTSGFRPEPGGGGGGQKIYRRRPPPPSAPGRRRSGAAEGPQGRRAAGRPKLLRRRSPGGAGHPRRGQLGRGAATAKAEDRG